MFNFDFSLKTYVAIEFIFIVPLVPPWFYTCTVGHCSLRNGFNPFLCAFYCRVIYCQTECHMPIIYQTCHDRAAALFIGFWNQKSLEHSTKFLEMLDPDLDLSGCQLVLDFDPDRYSSDLNRIEIGTESTRGFTQRRGTTMIPDLKADRNRINTTFHLKKKSHNAYHPYIFK